MTDLAEKYRPSSIGDMLGGEEYEVAVKSGEEAGSHSWLLVGPSGTGKTTLGRCIATEIFKTKELLEIDAAATGKADDARRIGQYINRPSLRGRNRVLIIDEVHAASTQALQVLLKPIEEPASGVQIILCTTEEKKVPATIRTRCAKINVRLLNEDELIDLLDYVRSEEGWETPEEIIDVCASQARGSARQALQNLGMVWKCKTRADAAHLLRAPGEDKEIVELCRALIGGANWQGAARILKGLPETDAESIRLMVVNYMNSVVRGEIEKGKEPERAIAILDAFSTPCRPGEGMAGIYIAIGTLTLLEEEE